MAKIDLSPRELHLMIVYVDCLLADRVLMSKTWLKHSKRAKLDVRSARRLMAKLTKALPEWERELRAEVERLIAAGISRDEAREAFRDTWLASVGKR